MAKRSRPTAPYCGRRGGRKQRPWRVVFVWFGAFVVFLFFVFLTNSNVASSLREAS